MVNEDKQRLTCGRVRLLDVVLLLLAVLTVIVVWQKQNLAYIFEADHTPRAFTVSFLGDAVAKDAADGLAAEAVVYLHTENGPIELGTLVGEPVQIPHATVLTDEQGNALASVTSPTDSAVDVTGNIVCLATLRGATLLVGEAELNVGETVAVTVLGREYTFSLLSFSENR